MIKKNNYILTIVTVTLLTTALHYTTMWELSSDVVLEELYYLPLLLGVLRFGLPGAILSIMPLMPRSKEEVLVTTGAERKGLFVAIKDRGAGMDRDALSHLFEPFYTTKGDGGTGLGMPIAKKICEEHGGTLLITSQQGVGTEAKVWLPGRKIAA